MATEEEIEMNSDDCAICWDKLEVARILPCKHMFHKYVRSLLLNNNVVHFVI